MQVYKCRVLCVNLAVPDVGASGIADLVDLADAALILVLLVVSKVSISV